MKFLMVVLITAIFLIGMGIVVWESVRHANKK